MFPQPVALDPTLHSKEVIDIKQKLLARTIGQDHAVDKLAMILETFQAGFIPDLKLTIVLLDEIEKAHQDFYQYLLAIFNDGESRVDGKDADFSRVLFVMTSNLGATDIERSISFSQTQLEQLN